MTEFGKSVLNLHKECDRLETENKALREEVGRLHSTMIAAAEEIHEHWDAHCDDEGYGPSNLMYRLEKCIDADYPGYTAGAFARLEQEVAALRARVVVVPEMAANRDPWCEGWNLCLDELARLNGKVVSEGLLRRVCLEAPAVQDMHEQSSWELAHFKAVEELRALLDEGKEVGDVPSA